VGPVTAVGGILLQFRLPELPTDVAVPRRLRPRPTGRSAIHTGLDAAAGCGSAVAGPRRVLGEIKDRLEQAQQHYKSAYDAKHLTVEFNEGDWVRLRLLQWPVASLSIQGRSKLEPKFFGPFKILQRIGSVAYKLELPAGARLYNVFPVGLLKPFKGASPTGLGVLLPLKHGRACPQPAEVIKGRLARGVQELLIRWEVSSVQARGRTYCRGGGGEMS
jgi:hypothetical protein